MATYNNACRYLMSLNFHYSPEWLSECVNYFKSNNPSMSESELQQEVKQQWLLSNLRDMKVETMIDSGQSRFSQLQTLRNNLCDNVKATTKKNDEDLPARRCLTLTLTDGVQDLQAMEYEQVPGLKLNDPNLLPGFKMIISGPVVCRKGMIMLTSKSVDICGGEVDDLIEKNRLEVLLASSLGMDPTERIIQPPRLENNPTEQVTTNEETNLLDNDDFLFDLPLEEEPVQVLNNQMKIISPNPFVYLSQIKETEGMYKIKAVIITLKTKISIKGEEFILRAKISDGSLAIDVEFCSEVLETFLGFTPSEMIQMVREKNKNSAMAERLKNAFQGAQNKLIALNCILHVKFFTDRSKIPIVMSTEEISRKHLNEIFARKL